MLSVPTTAAASGDSPVTYRDAVTRGDYDLYTGNLYGKHDNVRIYWEDQLTRLVLRPFLSTLMNRQQPNRGKVRILDLGCGSGQGYDMVTRIDRGDLDLSLIHDRVIPEDAIELYLGLDLDEAMVAKGCDNYVHRPQVRFRQADLRDGLRAIRDQVQPFDLYLSAYGALSHLTSDHLHSLLTDICQHGRHGSLVVLDLLGRNSVEWPQYWSATTEAEKWRQYSMSYLNPHAGADDEIETFPLRFWTGAEIEVLLDEIRTPGGARLKLLKKLDRSIMVGRHVDTGEYNPRLKPMRRTVNRLHEDYMRTDLDKLCFDLASLPSHPDPEVNAFFAEMITSWNTLVEFCQLRLTRNVSLPELDDWASYSTPLQFALMTMDRVIDSTEWIWYGDPRANVIEPQLGYALRSLETNLQRGLGCGHGLLVVAQIVNEK